jgi:hypothetical protein
MLSCFLVVLLIQPRQAIPTEHSLSVLKNCTYTLLIQGWMPSLELSKQRQGQQKPNTTLLSVLKSSRISFLPVTLTLLPAPIQMSSLLPSLLIKFVPQSKLQKNSRLRLLAMSLTALLTNLQKVSLLLHAVHGLSFSWLITSHDICMSIRSLTRFL